MSDTLKGPIVIKTYMTPTRKKLINGYMVDMDIRSESGAVDHILMTFFNSMTPEKREKLLKMANNK